MTFTVLHPEQMVNPSNWRENAHGHATNIRRGTGEQSDLLLADLVVKSSEAIQAIYQGVDQISCGYDAEYRQTARGKPSNTTLSAIMSRWFLPAARESAVQLEIAEQWQLKNVV